MESGPLPGEMQIAIHSDDESVSIREITECARIYLGTTIAYCGIA